MSRVEIRRQFTNHTQGGPVVNDARLLKDAIDFMLLSLDVS